MPKRGGSQLSARDFHASDETPDRLLADLDRSMQSGELCDSQLARVVLACCQPLAPIELTRDYDFESLAAAIHDADELIRAADALAGKLEARESAILAVRRVVMSLAQAAVPSRRLHTLVVRLTEKIFALDEIAMTVRWPAGGKDEFYNTAIWGHDTEIGRLLEEYSDD